MDDGSDTARIRHKVSELGEKFLRRTRSEAVALRVLLGRSQDGDTTVLPELASMAHKIHGSGAVFGFQALSEYAGEIEYLAERLVTAEDAPDVHTGQRLRRLAECIERLAQAVEAGGTPSPVRSAPPS
jgi:HPt (histidine-containing phosphotransfer) domain-containing protein